MKIRIDAGTVSVTAELNDSITTQKIEDALPFEAWANRWGDEIYFEIPVDISLADDAVETLAMGSLAYWPSGKAMCIFFGPTPASTTDQPRAYSPVNVFGRIMEDATILTKVKDGTLIKVKRLSE